SRTWSGNGMGGETSAGIARRLEARAGWQCAPCDRASSIGVDMFGPPIHDITAVSHLGDHRLHLVFKDGIEGDVDVAKMIEFRGIFAPLRNVEEFRKVFVDPEAGTVVWPNG